MTTTRSSLRFVLCCLLAVLETGSAQSAQTEKSGFAEQRGVYVTRHPDLAVIAVATEDAMWARSGDGVVLIRQGNIEKVFEILPSSGSERVNIVSQATSRREERTSRRQVLWEVRGLTVWRLDTTGQKERFDLPAPANIVISPDDSSFLALTEQRESQSSTTDLIEWRRLSGKWHIRSQSIGSCSSSRFINRGTTGISEKSELAGP